MIEKRPNFFTVSEMVMFMALEEIVDTLNICECLDNDPDMCLFCQANFAIDIVHRLNNKKLFLDRAMNR